MRPKIIFILFLYSLIPNGLVAQSPALVRLKLVDSLFQQLDKVDTDAQKATIYFQLLDPKNKVKKYRPKIIAGALNLAQRSDNEALAALTYLRGSLDLISSNQFKKANNYLKSAYNYYAAQPLNENLVTIMILQGYYFHRQNYSKEALKTYLKALPLAKELKDLKRTNNLYNRIVNIYLFQKEYDKALFYARLIKQNCATQNDVFQCPFYDIILQTIGEIYLKMNQLDSARLTIELTRKHFKTPSAMRGVYGNLSLLNQKEGQYKQALIYADSSLNLAISTKKPLAAAHLYFSKATISEALGDVEQAIYNLKQQVRICNDYQFAKKKMEALDKLSEIYKAKNDYATAYNYIQDWRIVKDSIAEIEQTNSTKQYDDLLSEYKKEEQLQSLQQKQLLQQNQRNILLSTLLFLALFLGLAIFFLQMRKRLNISLQEKNKLLSVAVADKELLIKEVHHRVKNNLQIITSLLNLQMRHASNTKAKTALQDSQNRIRSMALIHQHLYEEENITEINSKTYIKDLLHNIQSSFTNKEIIIDQKIDSLLIDQESMVLIGLVINEAITNIFKHAFPDTSEGLIQFVFEKQDQHILLTIEDNGIGLPTDFKARTANSFGLQLIQDIATKLKAKYNLVEKKEGTILQMKVPC